MSTPSPEGPARWKADVAAFLGSRHVEHRPGIPDLSSVRPAALPGETLELAIYATHWLFRVDDPPGYGWRLVGWADLARTACLMWELPGYTARDARILALAFLHDYLG